MFLFPYSRAACGLVQILSRKIRMQTRIIIFSFLDQLAGRSVVLNYSKEDRPARLITPFRRREILEE
jgi:hypothetical protein